ncbi:RnfH family protein [Denitromonas iodatirespirans]|uniref:UPF0125 protein I8J34_21420 n=1 Tax=Denitromonas iodatirespirans TaxID=2795389 RepID=A0A944DC28_DENI1|nr:RnfH family protein [Denitromonas iodatirespirans]MBT0963749.1 RnfH family protein [Denitromonas iodatirespirans]
MTEKISVEVVYALRERQEVVPVKVPDGATAQDAIHASGLLEKHPEIDLDGANKIGIYAKLAPLSTVLRERDRVEIYRPLIADPKEVRRKRAKEGKVMKKGGGEDKDASEEAQ